MRVDGSSFALNPQADIVGAAKVAQIALIPRRLVERFGTPQPGDGYKVSGRYLFADGAGHVYEVYDWKETSLADDELEEGEVSLAPTPQQFWSGDKPVNFNVAGRNTRAFKQFKAWLLGEVA